VGVRAGPGQARRPVPARRGSPLREVHAGPPVDRPGPRFDRPARVAAGRPLHLHLRRCLALRVCGGTTEAAQVHGLGR
ncbi:unnamed protein product, partial [Prorocentrum cordatum]